MMEQLFITVLNMSLTGSVIILAMLIVRLCFRNAPRSFSYVLWAVVLFRLLCPISFTSNLSFLGIFAKDAVHEGRMEYIPEDIGYQMEPKVSLPVPGINDVVNESLPAGTPAGSVNPLQIVLFIGTWIWILGMAVLMIRSILTLFFLKKKLKAAVWERDNIYRMPGEGTPFVYGIFRPRIYLSQALSPEEERYMLLHEQIHIRRMDPLFRTLAYAALCIHWFNPFVWLAFSLSEKDMEMSCDEAVIRQIGSNVKKKYSASLLALASGHRIIKGIPLAFGEGDTKQRIENVLRYRKPTRILIIAAVIASVILAIQFLAYPADEANSVNDGSIFYSIATDLQRQAPSQKSQEQMTPPEEEAVPYLSAEDLQTLMGRSDLNGTFRLNIQSIARSSRGIDRYVINLLTEDSLEELPFLAFADNCVFRVNREMNSIRYEDISFDEFAELAENSFDWINPLCTLYFQDNLISYAILESAWYGAGITYEPFVRDTWYSDIQSFPETAGIDPLETYYTQVRIEKADFGDGAGIETAEIYTGNIGDGDSGIVLFKDEAGEILYSEGAHTARAGWNNIYLGEIDGTPFLMRQNIEDRDTFGGYVYQVFRLGENGEILQIAGSSYNFDEDRIPYDEEIVDQWMAQMNTYLEHSHLLLSTQDGVVRTE